MHINYNGLHNTCSFPILQLLLVTRRSFLVNVMLLRYILACFVTNRLLATPPSSTAEEGGEEAVHQPEQRPIIII